MLELTLNQVKIPGAQKSLRGLKIFLKEYSFSFGGFIINFYRGMQKALFRYCAFQCVLHLPLQYD